MIPTLSPNRHAQDLRETWQGRVLAAAQEKLGAITMSVLAHSWPDAIETLCHVVFPNFKGVALPALCSAGKILKDGYVVADVVTKSGRLVHNHLLFFSKQVMEAEFRRLADQLKLSDPDRTELFAALKRWVVCDYGLAVNRENVEERGCSVH